jgi:hypothetical protein
MLASIGQLDDRALLGLLAIFLIIFVPQFIAAGKSDRKNGR